MAPTVRPEGVSGIGAPVLTTSSVEVISAKTVRQYSKGFMENAAVYANIRVQKGLSPEPRQIISDVGFTDHPNHYGWAFLPPPQGSYRVFPKGRERPWAYIMLHNFGGTHDMYYMKKSKARLLGPQDDETGHFAKRWNGGIRELCALKAYRKTNPNRNCSIHFLISRRGDIVASCDLNDQAKHGGGGKAGVTLPPKGNNYLSVGIELEAQLMRSRPGQWPFAAPFPDRQMIALAILCKKLTTLRAIANTYISKQNGSVLSQAAANPTGYIQHLDVKPAKTDAGAQFDILPGTKGSGWDQLWGYMAKMRSFNIATDVFRKQPTGIEIEGIEQMAAALQQGNSGQRMALKSNYDRVNGLRRAANMQAQTRGLRGQSSLGQASTLNGILSALTGSVARVSQQYDISGLPEIGGNVQRLNETTGLWEKKA